MTLRQPYRRREREKAATARIVYDEEAAADEDMDAVNDLDEDVAAEEAAAVSGLRTRPVDNTMLKDEASKLLLRASLRCKCAGMPRRDRWWMTEEEISFYAEHHVRLLSDP